MNILIELTKDLRPFSKDRFLLAISGGLDSMALFHIFLHFRNYFNFNFSVAHFHHGPSSNRDQEQFRFEVHQFVKSTCELHNVSFYSNFSENEASEFLSNWSHPLNSEEEFRDARYSFLEKTRESEGFDHLVLAHNQEDLLETRVIRLLRGTGPEGLKAMGFRHGARMRPLLDHSRDQLEQFLELKKGAFIEDPSNQDPHYLRNWIRYSWLKDLEERYPGGKQSLNRSLDLLVSSLDQSGELDTLAHEKSLSISELLLLSEGQRSQVVAAYMKSQGLRNYGLSHIKEVLKRLDREEKSHTFRLLGRCWKVDAGRMSLLEPS